MDFLRPYAPQLLSVLRIMSGLLLLQHGTTKFLNFPAGPMNNASPMTMSGAAGVIELVFGVLLVIGLFTRLSAFICSGMTAVAYFYAHCRPQFLPDPQRRRTGRTLFVRVPVPRGCRRRAVERRSGAGRGLISEPCA